MNTEGFNMSKNFDLFRDFTGDGGKIDCKYHGVYNPLLEAAIHESLGSLMKIGISIPEDNIARYEFNSSRNSLDIWYKHLNGVGFGITRTTYFIIRKETKEINVYDYKNQVI